MARSDWILPRADRCLWEGVSSQPPECGGASHCSRALDAGDAVVARRDTRLATFRCKRCGGFHIGRKKVRQKALETGGHADELTIPNVCLLHGFEACASRTARSSVRTFSSQLYGPGQYSSFLTRERHGHLPFSAHEPSNSHHLTTLNSRFDGDDFRPVLDQFHLAGVSVQKDSSTSNDHDPTRRSRTDRVDRASGWPPVAPWWVCSACS